MDADIGTCSPGVHLPRSNVRGRDAARPGRPPSGRVPPVGLALSPPTGAERVGTGLSAGWRRRALRPPSRGLPGPGTCAGVPGGRGWPFSSRRISARPPPIPGSRCLRSAVVPLLAGGTAGQAGRVRAGRGGRHGCPPAGGGVGHRASAFPWAFPGVSLPPQRSCTESCIVLAVLLQVFWKTALSESTRPVSIASYPHNIRKYKLLLCYYYVYLCVLSRW